MPDKNGTIVVEDGNLMLRVSYDELALVKCRAIPQRRWIKSKRAWKCRPTLANMDYISQAFPYIEWSDEADELYREAREREKLRGEVRDKKQGDDFDLSVLDGVPFKYEPFEHQKKALLLGRNMPYFAYLMDQGTGKTKVLLDDAAHNFRQDRIDAVLVIAPNSVKNNWVHYEEDDDAVSMHMAPDVDYLKAYWESQPTKKERKIWDQFQKELTQYKRDKLIIFAVNIEAVNLHRCEEFLTNFCSAFRTMIVVDESTRIKTPGAKRTKAAHRLRKLCPMARILSGTPIIQSPLNAYSQFTFLDEDVLGYSSYYTFKNRYAVWGGFENRQVLFYQNLDELSDKIASCSYRVLKKDCLDLPPQVYDKRRVYMTKEQMRVYDDLKTELLYRDEDTEITADLALTNLLRLQEVTSGFIPIIDPDTDKRIGTKAVVAPEHNPKFKEVMDIIDESGDQKIIIWCRFTAEVEAMTELLEKRGITHVQYYGKQTNRERTQARLSFQSDDGPKVLVGNPAAGGIGIDLYAASIVCYLSNSFDTEARIQSEDRAHRYGSQKHVKITYYDFVVPNTVDVKIVRAMRQNKSVSDEIMKDGWKEWI